MADARGTIFAALRAAHRPATSRPSRTERPPRAADSRVARFTAELEAAGGRLIDVGGAGPDAVLDRVAGLATAEHVYSAFADLPGRGAGISASDVAGLDALDFAVLVGRCGVAENGAVWHEPKDALERGAALLAEHLVLILDVRGLVDDLHDAYAQIDVAGSRFGWFLCGPSKTADIEQALVLGAHGPRRSTVVLHGGPTDQAGQAAGRSL